MAKKLRTLPKKLVRALAQEWAERFRSEEFEARSRAAKKAAVTRRKKRREKARETRGFVRYEPEEKVPHIPTVAREDGLDVAQDVAREWGIHPDEWADEVSEDFDYETHSLYQEHFYPASGSAAW